MSDGGAPPTDRELRLSIGGVMAETLRGFGRSPAIFLLVGVVSQLPGGVQLLVGGERGAQVFTWTDAGVFVLDNLISALTDTIVISLYARQAEAVPARLGDAVRLGFRRYGPMLGTTFLIWLAFVGGAVLLIVPAIIVAAVYEVAGPVCALESSGPVASLKRSADLTRGARWRIVGITLVLFAPALILALLMIFVWTGSDLTRDWINAGFFVVWNPISTIAAAATYRALRRLKENIGVAGVFD